MVTSLIRIASSLDGGSDGYCEVLKGARVFHHYMIEKRLRETSGETFAWTRIPGWTLCF
jgi:hypothetical protein